MSERFQQSKILQDTHSSIFKPGKLGVASSNLAEILDLVAQLVEHVKMCLAFILQGVV